MNIGRIIIVIIAVALIAGLFGIKTREKGMSKKEGFWIGVYTSTMGCIIPLLINMFWFFVTVMILYAIYSWIFG